MKKVYLRVVGIILAIIFSCLLYMILMGPVMSDFLSVIRMGNIISYNKTFALIGGIPLICYALLLIIMTLFTKDVQCPKLPSRIESCVLLVAFVPFITGIILNFLVPFLLMASPYIPCPKDHLSDVYVTDLKFCKNVKPVEVW